MISKDEIKKVVDKLPDNLLDEVYALLKKVTQRKKERLKLTIRDFKGKLDQTNFREAAYE